MKAAAGGLALLLGTLMVQAGEADRHEAVIKQMLTNLDKIVSGLASIKDEPSAKAAHGTLKPLNKDWVALRKKAEDLPPPTPQERDQLVKKYKVPLESAQKKLTAEVDRVRNVPGGPEALVAINDVLAKKPKKKKE